MNRYVDSQWRKRYQESIIENPIKKKTIQDDYWIQQNKFKEELRKRRERSWLF